MVTRKDQTPKKNPATRSVSGKLTPRSILLVNRIQTAEGWKRSQQVRTHKPNKTKK